MGGTDRGPPAYQNTKERAATMSLRSGMGTRVHCRGEVCAVQPLQLMVAAGPARFT